MELQLVYGILKFSRTETFVFGPNNNADKPAQALFYFMIISILNE